MNGLRSAIAVCGLGLLIAAAVAPPATATTFIVGNDGGQLGFFTSAKPGKFRELEVKPPGLGPAETFAGLDARPATGKLYATTSRFFAVPQDYMLYRVKVDFDRRKAEVIPVGSPFTTASFNNDLGVAFDPVLDQLRVVNDGESNSVVDPVSGAATAESALAYETGDPNQGNNPGIDALAYTKQRSGAMSTDAYAIDELNGDVLVRLGSPATGELETVGPLDVNTTNGFSFDIAPNGKAFAQLYVDSTKHVLHRINLQTGKATKVGKIGGGEQVSPTFVRPYSMAILPPSR